VPRLFEDTARAWPDAVAVRFEDAQMSYRELDARANQLAQRLRAAGVGVESRVAVGVERSLEMVVAVLGVLKAGGAYVPVDRTAPRERVRLMLDEAEVRVAVSDAAFAEVLDGLAAQVVRVDDASLGEEPVVAPPLELSPANLAYVMYTSGSTGVPKAVGVTHQAIVRLVRGVDYCRFSQRDVILQAGPLAFDASTFELWGALLNGGCLALLPHGVPAPDVLERTIERHGVTTLWLTAALFHAVVAENPGRLARVEQLLTGGDVVSPAAVAALARAAPGCRIIMGYGPTETTTFASAFQATGGGEWGAAMPIGTPLSNARLYVLDSAMEPVPPGTPGELYIAGDGLARGYLNRADLTAERFVPDPFSEAGGERLYRTGDRVRLRPDGALDFLGRVDFQVKLRGYRLELGEVEDALRRASMRDAVVLLDDGGPAGKRLVAYAVPSHPTDAGQVRAALKERVPEYMVPAAVVLLEALPLNANGKVDRAALPPPPVEREARTGAGFVAPEGPMEEALAAIWKEVLGLATVGTRDSFFDLGGNSLSLVTLAGRIRERLGADLPLRALLEEPTIAEQALSIEERLIIAAEAAANEIGARDE
jgi:amino acid adenylation domain-containing protein